MTQSPELKAMVGIDRLLSPLEKDQQSRVLKWVNERFHESLAEDVTYRALSDMTKKGREEVDKLTDELLEACERFNGAKAKAEELVEQQKQGATSGR